CLKHCVARSCSRHSLCETTKRSTRLKCSFLFSATFCEGNLSLSSPSLSETFDPPVTQPSRRRFAHTFCKKETFSFFLQISVTGGA
ncbi:Memo family protein, partial [Toxoplasma gondii FOU]